MGTSILPTLPVSKPDQLLTETVTREQSRLRSFIRKRVANAGDAEDILQEVFYEATAALRMPEPVEQVTAWMYRVALNRITDLFRRKKTLLLDDLAVSDDEELSLEELLPSDSADPEQMYARTVMLEALYAALDDLPAEQREVFLAHEIDGKSFREIAENSSISINTLLSRKRYAVAFLRERLQLIYRELYNEKG